MKDRVALVQRIYQRMYPRKARIMVKTENKEENANHSLVFIIAPFLRPQVISFVPF